MFHVQQKNLIYCVIYVGKLVAVYCGSTCLSLGLSFLADTPVTLANVTHAGGLRSKVGFYLVSDMVFRLVV